MTKEEFKEWFKQSFSYEVEPVTYRNDKSNMKPTGAVWITLKLDEEVIAKMYINPMIEENL